MIIIHELNFHLENKVNQITGSDDYKLPDFLSCVHDFYNNKTFFKKCKCFFKCDTYYVLIAKHKSVVKVCRA